MPVVSDGSALGTDYNKENNKDEAFVDCSLKALSEQTSQNLK